MPKEHFEALLERMPAYQSDWIEPNRMPFEEKVGSGLTFRRMKCKARWSWEQGAPMFFLGRQPPSQKKLLGTGRDMSRGGHQLAGTCCTDGRRCLLREHCSSEAPALEGEGTRNLGRCQHLHLLKNQNMFYFPWLVLNGIHHYWKYVIFFPGASTKWKKIINSLSTHRKPQIC